MDSPDLRSLALERARMVDATYAPKTHLAYENDWRLFCAWASDAHRQPLPASADTVTLYLTDLLQQGRKISTATRRASAINYCHRIAGMERPWSADVTQLLAGCQRLRLEQPTQKQPVSVEQLREICGRTDEESVRDVRNRSILLLGFASALRRSNLAALDMTDVAFSEEGLTLNIRKSKTDQEGKGRLVGIPWGDGLHTCAVSAWVRWLSFRGAWPGPVFSQLHNGCVTRRRLHPNRISQVVKAAMRGLGLDGCGFGAHSLRAGFVTEGFAHGLGEIAIAQQTGHRSLSSLRGYLRPASPFVGNASGMIGL
jgi:integrase